MKRIRKINKIKISLETSNKGKINIDNNVRNIDKELATQANKISGQMK